MIQLSALGRLYRENDFPSDRLIQDEAALAAFTAEYNARTSAGLSASEMGDLLMTTRKRGDLPRLGRNWNGPIFK